MAISGALDLRPATAWRLRWPRALRARRLVLRHPGAEPLEDALHCGAEGRIGRGRLARVVDAGHTLAVSVIACVFEPAREILPAPVVQTPAVLQHTNERGERGAD